MAWTKEELFSYAQDCEAFTLFVESAPWKDARGLTLLVLANYSSCSPNMSMFPAHILNRAFAYAQQQANESKGNVRLRIHDSYNDIGVKSFRPRSVLSPAPEMLCSRCQSPAITKVVVLRGEATTTEHTCGTHYDTVRETYAEYAVA